MSTNHHRGHQDLQHAVPDRGELRPSGGPPRPGRERPQRHSRDHRPAQPQPAGRRQRRAGNDRRVRRRPAHDRRPQGLEDHRTRPTRSSSRSSCPTGSTIGGKLAYGNVRGIGRFADTHLKSGYGDLAFDEIGAPRSARHVTSAHELRVDVNVGVRQRRRRPHLLVRRHPRRPDRRAPATVKTSYGEIAIGEVTGALQASANTGAIRVDYAGTGDDREDRLRQHPASARSSRARSVSKAPAATSRSAFRRAPPPGSTSTRPRASCATS